VLTITYGSASFSDKNAANGKTVTVSGISVTGTDSANYTWNASTTTTANITPTALVVSATGQNRVYNGTTTATVTLGDNRIAGDVLTITYGSATFADKNVGTAKPITVTGINVTGADSINYTFNNAASTSANITPFALTVTATGQNRAYNDTIGATVTLSDNRFVGDTLLVSYATGSFGDKIVGTAKPISVTGINVTGADSANYTWNTTASAFANITRFALTITAFAQNKVYNGNNGAVVTLGDNRFAGDVLNVGYGSAVFSDKNAANGKTITVSGITVTGADSGNYSWSSVVTTTGNITPFALAIIATAQDKPYDRTTTATVTFGDNRISGDNITESYASATFPDKNAGVNKTVTVTGIALAGPDAGNYTSSTTASSTATISQLALTVTATGHDKVYDGTQADSVTLGDNRLAGDVLNLFYMNATFVDKNVGTGKTISVSGINVTGADATNYTFNTSASTTANITPMMLNVTVAAQSKAYDGTANASVSLGDNPLSGDNVSVSFTSASFSDKNVGNGKTVIASGISLSGPDAIDYSASTTANGTANITPELVVSGTSNPDTLRLMLDADGQHVDWFLNGTAVIGQLAANDPSGLTINAGAAGLTINLDRTNGNPLPALINLNGVFTVNGLQGSDPLAGTTLNVNRSTVFVTYADPAHDPLIGIRNDLHTGYNSGAWTGTAGVSVGSIRSANAANDPTQSTAVGYVDSASGTIAGQQANTIELKFTLYADTKLSGTVGFADFSKLTQAYGNNGGGTWDTGDWNYDGSVNFADFSILTRTYNKTLSAPLPAAAPAVAPALSATANSSVSSNDSAPQNQETSTPASKKPKNQTRITKSSHRSKNG